jgi:ribonuclease G
VSEEILINVTPQETRVAVVENGMLQELHIERTHARGILGNIYKGKVARILPGMQAAFVDIGLERAAFLHAADLRVSPVQAVSGEAQMQVPIIELLHEGEEIIVQVSRDPLGSKGARLTMNITLPARYLVYMPFTKHIGISQKIEEEAARERLRELLKAATEDGAQ